MPLHGRGPGTWTLVAELNACHGRLDLLAEEIGPCPSLDQATLEQWLIDAPGGFEGVAVRRAALIFALHLMEAVRAHFAADEPELWPTWRRASCPWSSRASWPAWPRSPRRWSS